MMNHLFIEKTGFSVPFVGLGTGGGPQRLSGQDAVHKTLDAAFSCGYRLIDTAQIYGNESEIGVALQELCPKHDLRREDVFITTKLHPEFMGKKMTRNLLLKSLRQLRLDYVDLFLIHYPTTSFSDNNPANNKEFRRQTWLEMEQVKADGLCKWIGVSNYEIRHIEEMRDYATVLPVLNQCEFHPHLARRKLVDYCQQHDIVFQAFTSLGRQNAELHEERLLVDIAQRQGVTVSEVLLAWSVQLGIPVIPKSSDPHRLARNFQAPTNVKLSAEEVEMIYALDRNQPYTACRPWDVV